jgi:hypothetical protein
MDCNGLLPDLHMNDESQQENNCRRKGRKKAVLLLQSEDLLRNGQESSLKGIVSRDEYFFQNSYDNKKVLSSHALIVFTSFCILVDEKIQLQVLACSFEITY